MKIIADDNIPFLRGRLEPVAEVIYADQFGFTPELVRDADALLIRTRTRCDADLLQGSKVKLVATATIGTDQIDMAWCRENGITVRNSPGCNAPGVAQYVWSALLRCGFNPQKETLGIVGCGNVGGVVREWAERLGAKVLINDPPKAERGEGDNNYCDIETLLRESDAVTLHTPLIKSGHHPTYHLIGERELSLIRDGKLLVNAARGPVVDGNALLQELKRGRLRAVVDTWEGEPVIDTALLNLVDYGTFHIAGYSLQGKQRATRMVIEAVEETFGVSVDKSGLEGNYTGNPGLTASAILESYVPTSDSAALKNAPESFDSLRRNYNYRPEVR